MDILKEKFLTVSDISDLLKLTKRTIYSYIDSGKLKAFKGRIEEDSSRSFIRVKKSELEKFIENNSL